MLEMFFLISCIRCGQKFPKGKTKSQSTRIVLSVKCSYGTSHHRRGHTTSDKWFYSGDSVILSKYNCFFLGPQTNIYLQFSATKHSLFLCPGCRSFKNSSSGQSCEKLYHFAIERNHVPRANLLYRIDSFLPFTFRARRLQSP
jgi:hypothetical protein